MDTALVGVISAIVGWSFFLIFIGMFKNFIATGFSIALVEILLRADDNVVEKLTRWFGKQDSILKELRTHNELLKKQS